MRITRTNFFSIAVKSKQNSEDLAHIRGAFARDYGNTILRVTTLSFSLAGIEKGVQGKADTDRGRRGKKDGDIWGQNSRKEERFSRVC